MERIYFDLYICRQDDIFFAHYIPNRKPFKFLICDTHFQIILFSIYFLILKYLIFMKKLLGVIFLVVFFTSIFAQEMVLTTRIVARNANTAFARQQVEQLKYACEYLKSHNVNLNDAQQVQAMTTAAQTEFAQSRGIKIPTGTGPTFPTLDDLLNGGKIPMSPGGLQVLNSVSTAMKGNPTSGDLTTSLSNIAQSPQYAALPANEQQQIGTLITSVDYMGQYLASSGGFELAAKKAGGGKSAGDVIGSCLLGFFSGAVSGALTGAGAALPGILAGSIIGGAIGASAACN